MFNTLKYSKLWFAISGIILLFGIISLLSFGLKLGIDFKGGSQIELQFNQAVDVTKVRSAVASQTWVASKSRPPVKTV